MSRVHDEADFNGVVYGSYERFPYFGARAEFLAEDREPCTVLIAGCGYGYLVDELSQYGFDVWGIEASEYAVGRASEHAYAHRIKLGDVRDAKDLIDARPDLIVTEDMISCVDDEAEAIEIVSALRDVLASEGEMIHIVTPHRDEDSHVVDFLWLTIEEWRKLLAPDQVLDATKFRNAHG